MINADWVQLNCRVQPNIENGVTLQTNQPKWHKDYVVEKQDFRTSLAASVYYVYYQKMKIAEVLTDVDNSNLDALTVFVRFDNKFLYAENLYNRVLRFLNDNGLVFHNWTRFDVACDFNRFHLHKHSPAEFIRQFLGGKVRLFNQRPPKKKNTSGGGAKRKRKGGVYFEADENGINPQTFYLGSPTSSVRAKLYNKTQEMRDKEDKPHIRETWELNPEIDMTADVWRLEFSILDFKSIAIGDDEIKFSLRTLEILQDEKMELLWNVLRENYFVFYREDGKKNTTRKKKITLFDYEETGVKLKRFNQKQDTRRKHKIFLKQLLQTQQTIRDNNALKAVHWAGNYIAAWVVYKHSLEDWVQSRFPEFDAESFYEPPEVEIPVYQRTLEGGFKSKKYLLEY